MPSFPDKSVFWFNADSSTVIYHFATDNHSDYAVIVGTKNHGGFCANCSLKEWFEGIYE